MKFSKDELYLMMLYSPGHRLGLVAELEKMKQELVPEETALAKLTDKVIKKLNKMTDNDFEQLDMYG